MRKSSIRAFGMAVFLIGALLTIADRFDLNVGLPTVASTTDKDMVNLQKKLDAANKEITSLKQASAQTNPDNTENESNKADDSQKSENEQEIVKMQLNIYRGISTYVISKMLEDGHIIPNHVEMDLLLANPKYARNLQIGTYEVNSSMSLEEIANTITRQQE